MVNSLSQQVAELKQAVQGIEKWIMEWVLEQGRKALKDELEKTDNVMALNLGGELVAEHIRPVWYTTLLGPIRVRRRQYLDKSTGKYRYLLDELLGMEKNDHTTINVKQRVLKLAAMMAFRKSAEVLEDLSAINISHQKIWKLLGKTADPHLEESDKENHHFLETGEIPEGAGKKVTNLIVEGDGVMISLQREKARKAEVKVSIAYEGWEQLGKDRYQTLNKTTYADVHGSQEHWAGMTLKLYQKYDLAAVKRVILGGDGAEWVKEGIDWVGGTFQLDQYHLNRELRAALGTDSQSIKLVREACVAGEVKEACQLLLEAEKRAKGEQVKKIAGVRRYILKNESGLRDYRLDLGAEGKALRRTGAMEGNNDKLIVRRMKGQGMSWTIKGCRRMLWVRLHSLDGTLPETLRQPISKTFAKSHTISRINRIIDKTFSDIPGDWLNINLPALYGPHQNRPWAIALKSLTGAKV